MVMYVFRNLGIEYARELEEWIATLGIIPTKSMSYVPNGTTVLSDKVLVVFEDGDEASVDARLKQLEGKIGKFVKKLKAKKPHDYLDVKTII